MSKRKSSADLRRGFNAPGRRQSVVNLQARAMSIVHRKPGATNVRSTSSYKVVQNQRGDMQCNTSNVPGTWKSSVTRNDETKMPKTRFHTQSIDQNTHTSRLKHFPVESVRKTSSTHKFFFQNPPTNTNADTLAKDLPSHGYGDTLKLRPPNEVMQSLQQKEQNQQSPKEAITLSQQHVPNEQRVSRINQSEAMLNERVLSPRQPIHRPFVPNSLHGTILQNLPPLEKSVGSPRLAAQQSYTPCAEPNPQQQREQGSSTAVEKMEKPRVPVRQHVPQISQQLVSDQRNEGVPMRLRNMIPWKVDDSPTVCDYEIQPIGGRNAAARGVTSGLDEKPDTQRQDVSIRQPTTQGQESGNLPVQQWGKNQQQHQCLNQQGLSTIQTAQNAQEMYQQLQNNMIRQQEMQRRAQQQMMVLTQQQMRSRPIENQLKTPAQQAQNIQESKCTNLYEPHRIYNGQVPISIQGVHPNKASIPHHRMLMQHRNPGFKSSQISPQHNWVHNRQLIGDHPSIKGNLKPFEVNLVSPGEQSMPSDDTKRYDQLKENREPVPASQHLVRHSTGIQEWQQGMHQYPIQHVQQTPNPISSGQYLSVQQEPQVAMIKPQQSMIQQHQHQKQLQVVKKLDAKKKYPEFTAEMIRDQELLVANMRQQKISENIMRRQFDALLCEQRHHLEFLAGREMVEKIIDPPSRRGSRFLHEDQRPDWMGRITPARVRATLNHQGMRYWDQERWRTVPEPMKQYDQRQQEISQNTNNPQHSKVPTHQLHNTKHRDMHNLSMQPATGRQYLTGQSASPLYTSGPQMFSQPQGTFSWSQPNNGSQSKSQCNSVQYNNLQADCQQQLKMQYGLLPNQLQEMHQTHQQQASDCQKIQQIKYMTPEQHYEHEKLMLKEIKGDNGDDLNVFQDQRGTKIKPGEPSSLLKLREYQKYIRPQMQNNGLQAAETVRAALEAFNSPDARKGLEYVTELGKKIRTLKLNGTQDPSELEKISPPPLEYLQRIQLRKLPVSSNGLCNTRNANNPAPPPISFPQKMDRSPMDGYPRRCNPGEKLRMNMPEGTHKMMAEKENGSVADTMQQNHLGIMFPDYGLQAMSNQYSPIQANARSHYLSHPEPIDDRCQWSKIPGNLKNQTKPQGTSPIMPYKFEGSEPMYQQQMQQFYRNQLNLKNSNDRKSNMIALTQGAGMSNPTVVIPQVLQTTVGDVVQPKVCGTDPNTKPDQIHWQGSSPIQNMIIPSQQSANREYNSHDTTRIVENKEAPAQSAKMQQATTDSNHGQPEIREQRTIGGLMYLARKVDYIQNPPLIAPHTLMASKFLQPSVSFD